MNDDRRLTRIEEKLDQLMAVQAEDRIVHAKNSEQLAYHIKRTDNLEESLKPVLDHVAFVRVAIKLLAFLATVAGLLKVFSVI